MPNMNKRSDERTTVEQRAENVQGNVVQKVTLVVNNRIEGIKDSLHLLQEQKRLLAVLTIVTLGMLFSGIYAYQKFYFDWRCHTSQVPDFRISIAGFSYRPDVLDFIDADEMRDWERNLTQRLQQITTSDIRDTTIQVWNSSCAGKISGTNESEWAISAQNIAERTKSGIVVFGHIESLSDTQIEVRPYFYIFLQNAYEAQEILGPYTLGSPFTISSLDPTTRRKAFSDEISSKILLLSQIGVGLTDFSVGAYNKAEEIFENALQDGYDTREQALLYVLAGNSAGKAGDLEKAKTLFQQAIELDNAYSRAYVGLGGVYYMQALHLYKTLKESGTGFDIDAFEHLTEESTNAFAQALTVQGDSSTVSAVSIEAKVNFGMGQVLLLRFFVSDNVQDLESAFLSFQRVITLHQTRDTDRSLRLLAAESHGRLGLISSLTNDCQDALLQYQEAYRLSWEEERKQLFLKNIHTLEEKIQNHSDCTIRYKP